MFCRPCGANHNNTPYITGVNTPAYAVTPLRGLTIKQSLSFKNLQDLQRMLCPFLHVEYGIPS